MRACVAVGTRGVPWRALAPGPRGRPAHGGGARRVLRGLLLGLLAALFALGVMSTGWMALVAVLIAAERLLPRKTIAGCGVAVALALLALGVAFAPEDVPGFTI